MVRLLVFLWLACLPGFAQLPVIFDTDMGNDVDDALALAMLHALENRGECKLIGVTLTNAHPDAVPFIHMMNRFYGRPSIPVGAAMATVKGGANPGFLTPALEAAPARLRIMNRMATPPAVVLLRSLLAESAGKVAIVQVGFSTNLAALLDSPADAISPLSGRELIRQKVGILSVMAGNFEAATPEYNVKQDIPPAKKLFENWPGSIVFSGFEIGMRLPYPATSIKADYNYVPWHPVVASYHAYKKFPYDRPTWDLTSVLAAVRPNHGYFTLSAPGKVTVDAATGATTFRGSTQGNRVHLQIPPGGEARILEALTLLSSEPPKPR